MAVSRARSRVEETPSGTGTLSWLSGRAPTRGLEALLDDYVGYEQRGVGLDQHRGMPSARVTVVVSLSGPVTARMPEGPPIARQAFAGGLHLSAALVEQDPYQCGLQLGLHPLAARSLLGVPAGDLAGTVVAFDELPDSGLSRLLERLAETSWDGRFRVLDEVLASRAGRARARMPVQVAHAWWLLEQRHGLMSVADLAREVGWSRRHLAQRFRREVGLSPKQVGRVLRFQRSHRLLRAGFSGGDSDLAAVCGFYDQAHLINEWRSLAGCTPGQWRATELPILQASTGESRGR